MTPYRGPARDGIEAQHGLNDVFPGDPMPPGGWARNENRKPEEVAAALRKRTWADGLGRLDCEAANLIDVMLAALKVAEAAIEDCHNYRSHNHFVELRQIRDAIAAGDASGESP